MQGIPKRFTSQKYLLWGANASAIVSLGDSAHKTLPCPAIMKARRMEQTESGKRPILYPLNFNRHFGFANSKAGMAHLKHGVKWESKRNVLLWRGATTGSRFPLISKFLKSAAAAAVAGALDIGFAALVHKCKNNTECKALEKPRLPRDEHMKFKYLLSIEGNDVSSGLKWMLFSNSVVFMPPPTRSTWAMEELLIPFVHYIPLAPDLSDVADKIAWARTHDAEARQIACQATEMMRKVVDPRENQVLQREVRELYFALFPADLIRNTCVK